MTPRQYREQARKLRQKVLDRRSHLSQVVVSKGLVSSPKAASTPRSEPQKVQPKPVIIQDAPKFNAPNITPSPVVNTFSTPNPAPTVPTPPKPGCGKCRRNQQK